MAPQAQVVDDELVVGKLLVNGKHSGLQLVVVARVSRGDNDRSSFVLKPVFVSLPNQKSRA